MSIEEIDAIGRVIRANRFYIKAEAIRAIAAHFELTVPGFDKSRWFARIEGRPWQPKTGVACSCRPGVERDNCPQCEGTGQQIDFRKIRAQRI